MSILIPLERKKDRKGENLNLYSSEISRCHFYTTPFSLFKIKKMSIVILYIAIESLIVLCAKEKKVLTDQQYMVKHK